MYIATFRWKIEYGFSCYLHCTSTYHVSEHISMYTLLSFCLWTSFYCSFSYPLYDCVDIPSRLTDPSSRTHPSYQSCTVTRVSVTYFWNHSISIGINANFIDPSVHTLVAIVDFSFTVLLLWLLPILFMSSPISSQHKYLRTPLHLCFSVSWQPTPFSVFLSAFFLSDTCTIFRDLDWLLLLAQINPV